MNGPRPDPPDVYRMYLSYGYPQTKLFGPWRAYNSQNRHRLKQNTVREIKRMYLNRRFIPSSTQVIIQEFPHHFDSQLLTLPFSSESATTVADINILECEWIDFSSVFSSFRLSKSQTLIEWYFCPHSIFYLFKTFFALLVVFNGLNNFQTISFWLDNINTSSVAKWTIFVNVSYSLFLSVCVCYTVPCKLQFEHCSWLLAPICCFLFGPAICIVYLMHILMNNTLNAIIRNSDSGQMERDVSYFILNKLKQNNCEILLNLSIRILNIGVIDSILDINHLQTNTLNTNEKSDEMFRFEALHSTYSDCLFDYNLCDAIGEKCICFEQNIAESVLSYFKRILKIFLLISLSCMVLSYVACVALFIENAHFTVDFGIYSLTFDFVIYSRIMSDILILLLWIYYVWVRWYKISQKFIQSSVRWLDLVSFDFFCSNGMDKNYGMKFLFNQTFHYCHFIDIYMNNYLVYQTLHTLYTFRDSCLLSNEILSVLNSYLWIAPNYDTINANKRFQTYDSEKLKAMVSDKQSELLLRLNELISMRGNYEKELEEDGRVDGTHYAAKYSRVSVEIHEYPQ